MEKTARLLAAIVLFALPAYAQNRDITLFAGAQIPGSITLSSATSSATPLLNDPLNAGTFGIRVGHGGFWGGEHTVAFTSKFLDGQSKSFIYNSNLRVQAPLPVVKPYVTGGVGTVYSWGSGLSDIGGKFAFNYGGGAKIMPAGPVGLRFDVRAYTIPSVQKQTLNVAEVSAGIVIAF